MKFLLLLLFFFFCKKCPLQQPKLGTILSSLPGVILPFSVFFVRQLSEDTKKVVRRSALSDEHQAWQGEMARGDHLSPSAPRSHLAPPSVDG